LREQSSAYSWIEVAKSIRKEFRTKLLRDKNCVRVIQDMIHYVFLLREALQMVNTLFNLREEHLLVVLQYGQKFTNGAVGFNP
tara:strand:- start:408 stop:656 length:249 start_codon:yes stop_codon:yes gene_type:complete